MVQISRLDTALYGYGNCLAVVITGEVVERAKNAVYFEPGRSSRRR